MELLGHIQNGVVVLDGGVSLPEGTEVRVSVAAGGPDSALPPGDPPATKRRVSFPLVDSSRPGAVPLTSQRIAEIMDGDDAAAGH